AFLINLPIGVFAAMCVLAQMRARVETTVAARVDYVGLAALIVGVGFRFAPASDAAPLITGTLPLITAIGAALVLGERFGMS
ncbi:hypothetical protein K4H02_26630, partial [Mycobacterium tuberculosis]|nr:hypothetical protein [Mycobacterium tuberculosis]